MPRVACFLALLLALSPRPAARAEMCTLDPVPAATLLLPYFEVDLEEAQGVNTLFRIHNALPEPTLVHATFWTDFSAPTLDFDIFLTGYDMETVNLRDVFVDGFLPVTADEQSDPDDDISPHGANPEWDGSFTAPPNCVNFFPFANPVIPSVLLTSMATSHTGQPVPQAGGNCKGSSYGDSIARGYITLDNAVRCAIEFPSDSGYFGGLDPVASDVNQLWGDFAILDPQNEVEIREPLVHIEADPGFDASSTASGYTFYGRYTGGEDHREPLGSTWSARFYAGDSQTRTEWLVWRDSTSSDDLSQGVVCGTTPEWAPMNEISVRCFDGEGHDAELCAAAGETDPRCFPYETQRVAVDDLSPPFDFGWCILDLGTLDAFTDDVDFPSSESPLAQSHVIVFHGDSGIFAVGHGATRLGGACDLALPANAPTLNRR